MTVLNNLLAPLLDRPDTQRDFPRFSRLPKISENVFSFLLTLVDKENTFIA